MANQTVGVKIKMRIEKAAGQDKLYHVTFDKLESGKTKEFIKIFKELKDHLQILPLDLIKK